MKFDPNEYLKELQAEEAQQKEMAASAPVKESIPATEEESSTISDFVEGAKQGATFGFADELSAALDVLRGKAPEDSKSLLDAYRALQKAKEAEYEKVKKRSGKAALAGELAGGIFFPIPGAAAGGLAKASGITGALKKIGTGERLAEHVGTGVSMGGLSGLGFSKGALEEDPSTVFEDVAAGSITGGAISGLLGKASDFVNNSVKKVKDFATSRAAKAAYELESGTRAGYEGPVSLQEAPNISPFAPRSGSQEIVKAADDLIKEEVEHVVGLQKAAKEELGKFIQKNGDDVFADSIIGKDKVSQIGDIAQEKAHKKALEVIEKSKKLQSMFSELKEKGKDDIDAVHSLVQENKKLAYIFGDTYNRAVTNTERSLIRDVLNKTQDTDIQKYFTNLDYLVKIADSQPNTPLRPIRDVLEQIDPDFIYLIKQAPFNIPLRKLFNFRKEFLQRAETEALESKLSPRNREVLFGVTDEKGMKSGGVFDKIEEMIKSSSKEVKPLIQKVKDRSKPIETMLNKDADIRYHSAKAWDLDDAELRKKIGNELENLVKNIAGDTVTSTEAADLLRDYFDATLKIAKTPEELNMLKKHIEEQTKKFNDRAYEYGAMHRIKKIDKTSDVQVGKLNPSKIASTVSGSTIAELAATAGSMKKGVSEAVEEIPSIVRTPVSFALKSPFTLRNATAETLKEVGDFLASSKNPAVSRFGQGVQESAVNNPAVRNAIINSAFQRVDIRRALGLKIDEEEKK